MIGKCLTPLMDSCTTLGFYVAIVPGGLGTGDHAGFVYQHQTHMIYGWGLGFWINIIPSAWSPTLAAAGLLQVEHTFQVP